MLSRSLTTMLLVLATACPMWGCELAFDAGGQTTGVLVPETGTGDTRALVQLTITRKLDDNQWSKQQITGTITVMVEASTTAGLEFWKETNGTFAKVNDITLDAAGNFPNAQIASVTNYYIKGTQAAAALPNFSLKESWAGSGGTPGDKFVSGAVFRVDNVVVDASDPITKKFNATAPTCDFVSVLNQSADLKAVTTPDHDSVGSALEWVISPDVASSTSGRVCEITAIDTPQKFQIQIMSVLGHVTYMQCNLWSAWATIEFRCSASETISIPGNSAPMVITYGGWSPVCGGGTSLGKLAQPEATTALKYYRYSEGKVELKATLLPDGIGSVLSTGWILRRWASSKAWDNGGHYDRNNRNNWTTGPSVDDSGTGDTSPDDMRSDIPSAAGNIYDLDAPACPCMTFLADDVRHTSEVYDNFRQCVMVVLQSEQQCSDDVLWHYVAQIDVEANPTVETHDLDLGNVQLPADRHYTPRFNITGFITGPNQSSLGGVTVTAGGKSGISSVPLAGGYTITGVAAGNNVTVTPALAGYTFAPVNQSVNITTADSTHVDFVGTGALSISGIVTRQDNTPIVGVIVSVGGGKSATTDNNGRYSIGTLVPGTYTATPSSDSYTFDPVGISNIVLVDQSVTGKNFTGTPK